MHFPSQIYYSEKISDVLEYSGVSEYSIKNRKIVIFDVTRLENPLILIACPRGSTAASRRGGWSAAGARATCFGGATPTSRSGSAERRGGTSSRRATAWRRRSRSTRGSPSSRPRAATSQSLLGPTSRYRHRRPHCHQVCQRPHPPRSRPLSSLSP